MVILTIFAFLAGIVTVLSPCILPVLPIVLSGSVGEGKRRPLGVVTGFVLSFTFFTLFLSSIVQATGISAGALRSFSVVVIIGFGLSLVIPQVQAVLERFFTFFSRFSPRGSHEGFSGGVFVGLSLGLIWTPCVGPILASVISLAITGSVSGSAAIITLAYAIGTALPMLAIARGGRQLLNKAPFLVQNTGTIQKAFGVLMIVTGLAIHFNVDRQFQTWILDRFPNYGTGLTRLEEIDLVTNQLDSLGAGNDMDAGGKPMFSLLEENIYPPAPELIGGTQWINSEPLTLANELSGKVVLIDFWTYSCINCIRTFPYVTEWYEKYKDQGFVIIGVHSPEFEFEKDTQNVLEAMADYGIEYPVVQDNEFKIWRAYQNRYWPAHYLIDKQGNVRYTHFGEGKYLETENKIRELLGETAISDQAEDEVSTARRRQTPEIYLGYKRAAHYTSENSIAEDQVDEYQFSNTLADDDVGISGAWLVEAERISAQEQDATLSGNFLGQKFHLVLSPDDNFSTGSEGTQTVQILLNGQPVPLEYQTQDMNEEGRIVIDRPRKYDLLDLGDDYGRHRIDIIFDEGVSAYAFTFSS